MLALCCAQLKASLCPCGCGQWADEAHDPNLENRWVVEETLCYPAKATADYRENNDVGESAFLSVRLGTEREAAEATRYDPEFAAEIYQRHKEKYGL